MPGIHIATKTALFLQILGGYTYALLNVKMSVVRLSHPTLWGSLRLH